jgi:hypothetical protein
VGNSVKKKPKPKSLIYKITLEHITDQVWKLKPIEGFLFPRKGNPSLTSPMKHGRGLRTVY